ncbi:protein-S-isoprenylcysteine methyltransferase [Pseudidiomarina salinarum]|uniref:Protein-S-isoprenylcysteine methyltransferase n=1 Tax=Pseudidiomarina salinarum TaxID=435908 RepID=A0A094JEK5_9GAMM|nr:isoprenylcysteine carboxylmethyltransferase family protein [Pseudidiomarina salinarum]KFZ31001.1 protein-S-isoprenylcysteine methyltransferase [Pseudidiomarina salinarum]RUO71485.1 isoprenylcysteine carboxylmethyltransferase family protein [Pseudidiomarina salinarum]
MSNLELKLPPLALVLLIGALMWLTNWLWPTGAWHFSDLRQAGVGFVVAGVLIAAAGVWQFRRAATTVNPMDPNLSSSLVQNGIYRFSRNPMYLGFLMMLIGWALWLGSLPALIWLPVFVIYMNRFQIVPEERMLLAKFGDSYCEYCRRVRRWF